MSVATAASPKAGGQAAALPFAIASRQMTRLSFSIGATALAAAANTPISPIQIPAVGYLSFINLQVTLTGAGGSPVVTADGPFNSLASVELKTAAGNDIIVPVTGYQLYLVNKYGCQIATAPYSDARLGLGYTYTTTAATFFLGVPIEIDSTNGLGAIPALASNRSYQLVLTAAALSTIWTGGVTSGTVAITGTAYYWSEPAEQTPSGVSQQTQPSGLGTLCQVQLEQPPLTPGDKYIKSNNVGNVIRMIIFVLRNSSGARIDTNGWPAVSELYLDNNPMFYLVQAEWVDDMQKWFGFTAGAKDTAGSLDTGVYVLPFYDLAGNGLANDEAPRGQLLPTLDASLLQLRGTSFGSAVSTLEIITQSIIPMSAPSLYARLQ